MIYIVNAGHGGSDSGAVSSSGIREADINLRIALKVEQYLQRFGHRVVMTRRDDSFVSLEDIVGIANGTEGAGAFVSIHTNSCGDSDVTGIEVWYPNQVGNEVRSFEAGATLSYLLDRYARVAVNQVDRGCKFKTIEREEFYVLRKTVMPAALIECGFLSNPGDATKLSMDSYQEKLAFGITMAAVKFSEVPV